jgi:hypothetical protein
VELLKEGLIFEDSQQFMKRVEKAKKKISFYRSLFKRIVVVSHYYTIQYLGSNEYLECGTPKFNIDIENCKPYFASVQEISRPAQRRLEANTA